MKSLIQIHPYSLMPVAAPNSRSTSESRSGVLIRIEFPQLGMGYADCFPWPELGDAPLNEQLESLRTGNLTSITHRSVYFAREDALARSLGKSLFDGLVIPPNHFLITDLKRLNEPTLHTISKSGFRCVKIKVGSNPNTEASIIHPLSSVLKSENIKLRLDFNSTLNEQSIQRFLEDLGEGVSQIDFLEDPIPFNPKSWAALHQNWKVELALDRIAAPSHELILSQLPGSGVSTLVVKPASQDPAPLTEAAKKADAKLVFTSSMDHPFGQFCAAWCAATVAKQEKNLVATAGLLSQSAYHHHSWSDAITSQGPQFLAPSGVGFGWGQKLESLRWEPI